MQRSRCILSWPQRPAGARRRGRPTSFPFSGCLLTNCGWHAGTRGRAGGGPPTHAPPRCSRARAPAPRARCTGLCTEPRARVYVPRCHPESAITRRRRRERALALPDFVYVRAPPAAARPRSRKLAYVSIYRYLRANNPPRGREPPKYRGRVPRVIVLNAMHGRTPDPFSALSNKRHQRCSDAL